MNKPIEKTCWSCGKKKSLSQFEKRLDGKTKDGHRNQCSECMSKIRNDWEEKHREYRKTKHREWYIKAKAEGRLKPTRQIFKERKEKFIKMLGGKCQNCGYNKCVAVFDFHHINKNTRMKTKESREYLYHFFLEKVKNGEIMLLCSNCHRELHYGGENNVL